MSANAPALRLLAGKIRIVNGITTLDIPPRLVRDSIFIIPYQLPQIEPQMRNVGAVITERFPSSRRETVGAVITERVPDRRQRLAPETREPQLVLYVVEAVANPPPPGG